ncbi:MAG: hypothetical protein M3Q75_01340 [Gemmatimonadota bacterium]|nr:hypothetical protein [Gemmatimonadota bacterium]
MSARSDMRVFVESALDEGDADLEAIAAAAVARFGADPAIVERIVRQGITAQVRTIHARLIAERARDPARLRKAIEAAAPGSPWAKLALSPRIELDVANMTKLEVLGLAGQCEEEASKATANAAFLRVVASELNDTETVAQRFDLGDLLRIKAKIHVNPRTEVYFGDKRLVSQGKAF